MGRVTTKRVQLVQKNSMLDIWNLKLIIFNTVNKGIFVKCGLENPDINSEDI